MNNKITSVENITAVYNNSLQWLQHAFVTQAAAGFTFTEGAAWHPDGYFLFSDTPANKIYKIYPDGGCTIYLDKSGLNSDNTDELSDQVGSNGIAINALQDIFICQHGNHAITKLNRNQEQSIVTDHYNGRPFNSPNDIIIRSDGALFFTDPPYGLKNQVLHPDRFQPVAGVYKYSQGEASLVGAELAYPNGLFFSADEKYLFVSSNHPADPGIIRYKLTTDGDVRYEGVFMEQHADGVTTGPDGHIYLATDEGVLVVSQEGKRLALISLPETPSNLCWGGLEDQVLLVTARSGVYFITVSNQKI